MTEVNNPMPEKVLLVDDDESLLKIYSRAIEEQFDVTTAASGKAALSAIQRQGPFTVVVSDMEMPGMDGAELLEQLKQMAPNTVRIMLTGASDLKVAEDAVNKGEVFRFVTKPPKKQHLLGVLQTAVDHHRVTIAENALLENTFKAMIEALANVLSITNPQIFGRTLRVKTLMKDCAAVMNVEDRWEFESAAMLSQLGCATLSDDLICKVFSDGVLNEQEKKDYHQYPKASAELINKIPKMEGITRNITYQLKGFDGSGYPEDDVKGDQIPLGARMLRVLLDFDHYESSGLTSGDALSKLERDRRLYDPQVLSALAKVLELRSGSTTKEVDIHQLNPSMIIAQDVYAKEGALLVCNGQHVSCSLATRLINFHNNGGIDSRIRVHEINGVS